MGRQGFHGEENQGCRSKFTAGISPVETDPAMAVDLNSRFKVKHSDGLESWLGLASQLSSNHKKQTAEDDHMLYEKKLEQYSKSLDNFPIFHNRANTRLVHSHNNSNDERTQELAPPMGRQKRLIKQTQKALEAAEAENLLKRGKRRPLSLQGKPGALNVSLASHLGVEGRERKSVEMATEHKKEHKVKGKENEAPVAPLILRFKRQKLESEVENEWCCKSLVGEEASSWLPKIRLKVKQSNDATLCPGLASEISSNDKLLTERAQEPAPPRGHQKRLVKPTRKALEAAEAETLLEKKKHGPLSLLDKPGALNVSLTSELGLEGKGRKNADIATECKRELEVKGKENKAPVTALISQFRRLNHESEAGKERCYKSLVGSEAASCLLKTMIKVNQSSDAKLWRGYSTDKMCDQLMETPKQLAIQTQQAEGNQNCLAHSHTKSTGRDEMLENHVPDVGLTKNYCIMEEEDPPATNQGELEQSVLNNSVRLVPGRSSYHRQLNQHERIMLQCEDDRYEVDMMLEIIQSTIIQTERWMEDINCGSRKQLQDYFNGSKKRCVERLYGSRGIDFLEKLQKNPDVVLPILLERLKQKFEETKNYRTEFNQSMADVFCENFKNSLDFSSKQVQ